VSVLGRGGRDDDGAEQWICLLLLTRREFSGGDGVRLPSRPAVLPRSVYPCYRYPLSKTSRSAKNDHKGEKSVGYYTGTVIRAIFVLSLPPTTESSLLLKGTFS